MSIKAPQIILGVLVLSLAYAVLHYHVFEAVPYKDFALYVLNKSLGLSAFVLLTLNFVLGPARALGADVPDAWLQARTEIGVVGFAFGLLHGLGFAGALSEVGLPEGAIPLALLFFNLGVEAGQLLFVAAVLALGWLLRRVGQPLRQAANLTAAYAIGGIAAYWMFDRIAGFWT